MKPSGNYNKKFQLNLLGHLIRDKEMLREFHGGSLMISQDDFDFPVHKSILVAAKHVMDIQGEGSQISLTALMNPLSMMIKKKIIIKEEVEALKDSLEYIFARLELAPEYFTQQLGPFLQEQRGLRELNSGNVEDLPALQRSLSNAISSSSANQIEIHHPMDRINSGIAEIPVPCGLASIDERMNGGLGTGRGMLICAFTGMGKTAFAVNSAVQSALMGFPARIAQLEVGKEEMDRRMQSCLARYSYDIVQFDNAQEDDLDLGFGLDRGLTREEITEELNSRIQEIPKRLLHNYGLYDFSRKTCTIKTLADYLHRDQDLNPDNPPMVLDLDWLECVDLPPVADRKKQIQSIEIREMRHKLEKNSELFNMLCEKEKIAGRVYTQSDFAAEDKAVVKMSNKSEGKGASRHFSWFLGIGATREDLANNILTVTAGKCRNGRLFSCQIRRALHEQRFEDLQAYAERQEVDQKLEQRKINLLIP